MCFQKFLLGAALAAVLSMGRSPAQEPLAGGPRVEGPSAAPRRVYGGFQGMEVKSLLPREREMARRLFPQAPGGGAAALDTVQLLFQTPGEGPPSSEGNGVLLVWGDLGAAGVVKVSVDGIFLGTVPQGETAALVTRLPVNCDPKNDPGCTGNLPPECVPFEGFDDSVNVHLFRAEGADGTVLVQCQQVLPEVPVFTDPSCCLRLDLADGKCSEYFDQHACDRLSTEGSCDIIVGGSNDGPPGSYLEVLVDGKSAFKLDDSTGQERFCFERSAPAGTRGSHEIFFERVVFRSDAATISWSDPDGTGFFTGLVGAFTGEFHCPDTVSTACGKPKAPTDLLVRQVDYGAGSTNALRASWTNGENPYTVGVTVFIDGSPAGSRLPGDTQEKLLGSLAAGDHQVEVQGDSGVPEGPSEKTGYSAVLKSTAPFPPAAFAGLHCEWSSADGGKTIATWGVPAGIALIDVLVKLASGGDFFLAGIIAGDSTGVTVTGTTPGDSVRLQPLKELQGQLYGLEPIDLPCAAAAAGQLPGDMNQDQAVDLSDAVVTLSFLFLGTPTVLPCGDGTPAHAGNKALLDWNGDGVVDLSDPVYSLAFLFLGGPTHLTGPIGVCKPIAGCPARCGTP